MAMLEVGLTHAAAELLLLLVVRCHDERPVVRGAAAEKFGIRWEPHMAGPPEFAPLSHSSSVAEAVTGNQSNWLAGSSEWF